MCSPTEGFYLVVPLRASRDLQTFLFQFSGVDFDSAVCTLHSAEYILILRYTWDRGVCLWRATFTPRSQTLVSHCGVSKKMNISKYNKTELKNTLICLSGGQMGSKMWLKISWHISFNHFASPNLWSNIQYLPETSKNPSIFELYCIQRRHWNSRKISI